jgi:zinc/manganese transport system substrate-binding protein
VVATTSILGDVVAAVADDCADVEVLMPAGTDPHDFEPSARQVAELREAAVVFAWGLGLEESLEAPLDAAAADGVPVVAVSEAVEPLPFGVGAHGQGAAHEEAEGGDDHGSLDPHVWQDPVRMVAVVDAIESALGDADACAPDDIEARAAAYRAELVQLDEGLAGVYGALSEEQRVLVTNHDAFGYLADRYGFEVVGTVIPSGSTLAEPSAADVVALAEAIREHGVPALFAETTADTALAEVLADEVGESIQVVELHSDSLGAEGSGAETYLELMRTNAERITGALGSGS